MYSNCNSTVETWLSEFTIILTIPVVTTLLLADVARGCPLPKASFMPEMAEINGV